MAYLGDRFRLSVAQYLAKQGRATSAAVARTLLEIEPDDFGLARDVPASAAELDALCAQLTLLRALPANDAPAPDRRAAEGAATPAPRAAQRAPTRPLARAREPECAGADWAALSHEAIQREVIRWLAAQGW
jgi:hypothetical protein